MISRMGYTEEELKREKWKILESHEVEKRFGKSYRRIKPYRISNLGRIMSDFGTLRILTPQVNNYGNAVIKLRNGSAGSSPRSESVAKLVAANFVDNPCGYSFVGFKDGDPLNLRASNIEWVKLTSKQKKQYGAFARAVHAYTPNGKYIRTYSSMREAADDMDIASSASIRIACHKKRLCAGLLWKYATDIPAGKDIEPLNAKTVYCQYDKVTDEKIAEFESVGEVAKYLRKPLNSIAANINNCCKGRRPSAYGYKWKKEIVK